MPTREAVFVMRHVFDGWRCILQRFCVQEVKKRSVVAKDSDDLLGTSERGWKEGDFAGIGCDERERPSFSLENAGARS